jgi:hypothetical protein
MSAAIFASAFTNIAAFFYSAAATSAAILASDFTNFAALFSLAAMMAAFFSSAATSALDFASYAAFFYSAAAMLAAIFSNYLLWNYYFFNRYGTILIYVFNFIDFKSVSSLLFKNIFYY